MQNAQIIFNGVNPFRPQASVTLTVANDERTFDKYPLNLSFGDQSPSTVLGITNTTTGYCKAQNDRGETLYLACIRAKIELVGGEIVEEHFVVSQIYPKNEVEGEIFDLVEDWSKLDKLTEKTLKNRNILFSLANESNLPFGFYFVNNLEFCDEYELEELFG